MKLKDDGQIDLKSEGLKSIDINLIEQEEENDYIKVEKENFENMEIGSNNSFSGSIIYFKNKFNATKKSTKEKTQKLIYGIYKIYSFRIKEEYLSLDESYLNKLEEIAQSTANDLKKAQDLEILFQKNGYLIPKKVYIGGIYHYSKKEIKNDNKKDLKINAELKFKNIEINPEISSSNIYKKSSKEDKLHIGGGNLDSADIEEWKSTVNIKNAKKIEVDDIIPVTELINPKIKNRLKGPLKIINANLELWQNYQSIIDLVKDIDLPIEKNGTYSSFESIDKSILKSPLIDCKCYFFTEKALIFGFAKKRLKDTFKNTIIGIKIIDTKTSYDTNGDWEIEENFLNSNNFHIYFEAKLWRSLTYFVIIYLLKEPELGMTPENRSNFELKLNGQKIGNMKDHNIEHLIEAYFKNNKDSEIIEKTLQGKNSIEITFNESKKFSGNVETKYVKKEKDDILDITKKRLKPINSIKKYIFNWIGT